MKLFGMDSPRAARFALIFQCTLLGFVFTTTGVGLTDALAAVSSDAHHPQLTTHFLSTGSEASAANSDTTGDPAVVEGGGRRRLLSTLLGAFKVRDGLEYNPEGSQTYTCQETCAALFGGGDHAYYYGSISATHITHTCYATPYGIDDYLRLPSLQNISSLAFWLYLPEVQRHPAPFALLDARTPEDSQGPYMLSGRLSSHWIALYVDGASVALSWSSFPVDTWVHVYAELADAYAGSLAGMGSLLPHWGSTAVPTNNLQESDTVLMLLILEAPREDIIADADFEAPRGHVTLLILRSPESGNVSLIRIEVLESGTSP
ncbi:hypothetical protein CYMTET_35540 [Cymbomonas tetramitiformis]|uniref:Uncharacterized protein n=1 Tax=Cymbomonas tetramitiformis TaxID=36881 RepID=A0AAE0F922_9CHLO|nr:hypothetical protein CYMTET_35540 [Cymbomonas tetramitiformis]